MRMFQMSFGVALYIYVDWEVSYYELTPQQEVTGLYRYSLFPTILYICLH